MKFELRFVSADAIMLYFGKTQAETMTDATSAAVATATQAVEHLVGSELVDLVPSYNSLLVIFNPLTASHIQIAKTLRKALANPARAQTTKGREVKLPVYYATEAGPDLKALAQQAQLDIEEVVALHCKNPYRVYAIGFAPGFAYLGDVDERIATPRLHTPRSKVPAGAVAIADRQTAVYPAQSPGGWNLIGLCPTPMFEPHADQPMPVAVGDQVRFFPISRDEFLARGGVLERALP